MRRERTKLIKLYCGNICSVSLRTQYCISHCAMYFFAVAARFSDKRTWVSPAALLLQRLSSLSMEQSVVSPVCSLQFNSQQSVVRAVKSFIQSVSQLNPPRAFSKLHAPSWFFIHCSFASLPSPSCPSLFSVAFAVAVALSAHALFTFSMLSSQLRPVTETRELHTCQTSLEKYILLYFQRFLPLYVFLYTIFTAVLPFGFCPHPLQVKCPVRRIC